ncbi:MULTISPECIES: aldehyde dehydrogenase family protein [unclassified Nocardiopsis]|uniref:aldehyde dehydrogenase family protein n=1 Tax=unclassified Nocardiopsis TaxID=2649073 RepID=UPI00135A8C4F|nr:MULTISPECIES: aldehyde dehydrogenase family protein [unclassified Nocardiopsis]
MSGTDHPRTDWHRRATALAADGRAHIGGRRRDTGGRREPVVSPANGGQIAELGICAAADVDRAVAAARRVQPAWAARPDQERKEVLLRLADSLERHSEELALLETLDIGKPITQTTTVDLPGVIATFRYYAEAIDKCSGALPSTPPGATALVAREPLGVVAAIVPWNYPLEIASWKVAPALAAGNSVVLKPSEQSSLTALRMADLAADAGLPDGALNVVTGGAETGTALAAHMDVDVLAFTGSTRVARELLVASGRSNLKRLALEAGGKSSTLVFADADLTGAAEMAAAGAFYNQGQVCSATSRILVERPVLEEFTRALVKAAQAHRPTDPLGGGAGNGALISTAHTDSVQEWIRRGKADGELLDGGRRVEITGSDAYLEPAVITGLGADHPLHTEEVFGPVAVVHPFDTEDEAVHLANATRYGLAASLWTEDFRRVQRTAARLVAGTVSVNTVDALSVTTPFGGFKQSGFGRDLSLHAFDNYTALKTTWLQWG